MQLLFQSSTEYGDTLGLGYLPGKVKRFEGIDSSGLTYKVPHMGWNELCIEKPASIVEDIPVGHVYFVHSFLVNTIDEVIVASSNYHQKVPAIVQKGSVYGMQFHPEKSGAVGMSLLQRFGQLVEGNSYALTIYPAIDILGGKCVRLQQGDYSTETIYGESPLAMAHSFEKSGAQWFI